jgi:bacterioferritin
MGEDDITTRRILEGILAVEEEHADDLASFLADMDKDWKKRDRTTG